MHNANNSGYACYVVCHTAQRTGIGSGWYWYGSTFDAAETQAAEPNALVVPTEEMARDAAFDLELLGL